MLALRQSQMELRDAQPIAPLLNDLDRLRGRGRAAAAGLRSRAANRSPPRDGNFNAVCERRIRNPRQVLPRFACSSRSASAVRFTTRSSRRSLRQRVGDRGFATAIRCAASDAASCTDERGFRAVDRELTAPRLPESEYLNRGERETRHASKRDRAMLPSADCVAEVVVQRRQQVVRSRRPARRRPCA